MEKYIADMMRKRGFPYTADYIEMFGMSNMNPWFKNGANEQTEAFYKQCVEEKRPWDYFVDPPDDDVML